MDYIVIILTSFITSLFTYFFAISKKKSENMMKFKEEKYANLLLLMQGFVGKTASGDLKRKFFEEQYKSWLYSSDNVILAINDLVKILVEEKGKAPNPEKGREVIGNIVFQMRKDLYGETNLTSKDFGYIDVID